MSAPEEHEAMAAVVAVQSGKVCELHELFACTGSNTATMLKEKFENGALVVAVGSAKSEQNISINIKSNNNNNNNALVATRKRMFEMKINNAINGNNKNSISQKQEQHLNVTQQQQQILQRSAPPLLKPQRVAPPPPPAAANASKVQVTIHNLLPTIHEIVWHEMNAQNGSNVCNGLFPPSPKQSSDKNDQQISSESLVASPCCSTEEPPQQLKNNSNLARQRDETEPKNGGIVKELAERLKNQFNPRSLLLHQQNSADSAGRLMTFSHLKNLHEEEEDQKEEEDANATKEVRSNGSDEREEEEQEEDSDAEDGYSDLSDATTATDMGEVMSRRQSSFGKGSSDTLQGNILDEMRNNGMFQRCGIQSGLPSELGRLRKMPKKSTRKGCISEPTIACAAIQEEIGSTGASMIKTSRTEPSKCNNDGGNLPSISFAHSSFLNRPSQMQMGGRRAAGTAAKTTSLVSSSGSSSNGGTFLDEDDNAGGGRSSNSTTTTTTLPHYETGDAEEDKRLRDLHLIMMELVQMQQSYVILLQHIGENYPKYIKECERQMNRRWLIPTADGLTPHVIERIATHFKQILGVHEMFLEEFVAKLAKWDSRKPDLADVFKRKGDFLKICSSFLKQKRTLAASFQQVIDENRELAHATRKFEHGILNEPSTTMDKNARQTAASGGNVMNLRGISIVMQLDAVHQNVVRYKLLMERYRKHLRNDSTEAGIADEALAKLTIVSNTVNEFLADADADKKLMELHRKLQGIFDVFAVGRKLLHEGPLQRWTRKELQSRYMILFSDTLLICRYTGALGVIGVTDSFDASNVYKIPIRKVHLEVNDHADYEQEFVVRSSKKSSAFVAKDKRDRDVWVQRIQNAKNAAELLSKKKKLSLTYRAGAGLDDELATAAGSNKANGYNDQQQQPLEEADGERIGSDLCDQSPDIDEQQQQQEAFPFGNSNNQATGNKNGMPCGFRMPVVWIPDQKATVCMVTGCGTRFRMYNRRHHCRQCGHVICGNCSGQSPVQAQAYEKCKVCPQCFYENTKAFEQGTFFPPRMIRYINVNRSTTTVTNTCVDFGAIPSDEQTQHPNQMDSSAEAAKFSVNDPNMRIVYGNRLFFPSELFIPPKNGPLLSSRHPVKERPELRERPLASGNVFYRNQKGVSRWARLTNDLFLQFYEAEFDEQPCESFFIYGFTVSANETGTDGMIIELTHRNQFQTDRKEDQIIFHVQNQKSAEQWLNALRERLTIEKPLEEYEAEEEDNG